MRRRHLPREIPRSLAIAALALGCDRPAPPAPHDTTPRPEPSSRIVAPAPPPANAKLLAALREGAVTDRSYARRTLFSWTTREQAQILRKKRTLLLDTELPTGPTPYVTRLHEIAAKTGVDAEIARALLLHPSLKLRRYAWTRPWSTRLPLGDHDYGDQLIHVVLAPDALVARFDPDRPDAFEVQDLDGRTLPASELLADPSRLAAVLHWRTGSDTPIAHREYVLCNESMVQEWSLTSRDSTQALVDDLATMTTMTPIDGQGPAKPFWHDDGTARSSDDLLTLYAQSLAFDDERYRPTKKNLGEIGLALVKAEQAGLTLSVVPSAKFASGAVVPNVTFRRPAQRVLTVV